MPQLTLQQAFSLALHHHQSNRLAQAEQIYRQILAAHPTHAESLHHLGLIAYQSGRLAPAADLIRQALALNPNFPQAHCNLGNVLKDQNQLDQSIAAYRQALALNPNFPEALSNLGNALRDAGQLDQAIAACRQAIALNPNFPAAYQNLARALRHQGHIHEAIAASQKAIALSPHYPEAYNSLGAALRDNKNLPEALAAFRHALAQKPNFPEAHFNLANTLRDLNHLDEAVAAFHHALAQKPNFPDALHNLANVLKDQCLLDDALALYRQAIALNPHDVAAHDNLLLTLNYHPDTTPQSLAQELHRWNQSQAQPLIPLSSHFPNTPNPSRRLRIGYVSGDFRTHASAFFLLPIYQHHDPAQFEIFSYAQLRHSDEITAQFQKLSHHWRDTTPLTDTQLAAQIRQDQIDILVDLKLHTADNRLLAFAQKPAPLQISWLGYPGSPGLATIDYRLTDPHLEPPNTSQPLFADQPLHLPHTFWCYDPLDARDIPINPLPALADHHITFASLNNFTKLNDPVLHLFAQILQSLPTARLLLLAPEGSPQRRTTKFFQEQNISPARIEFLPRQSRQQYLHAHHNIDITLDPFPYNGHTTSLDSLWMGIPLVTLPGPTPVSRAGLTFLTNLNLPDLIAQTPEHYLQIARNLAQDLPRLTHLRATLRDKMQSSPLMNAPQFTQNLEQLYRTIWQKWCTTPSAS